MLRVVPEHIKDPAPDEGHTSLGCRQGRLGHGKEAAKQGYRLVEAVVDSGAEESLAPPSVFPGKDVPSERPRAGGRYRAANGTQIPSL